MTLTPMARSGVLIINNLGQIVRAAEGYASRSESLRAVFAYYNHGSLYEGCMRESGGSIRT